MANRSGQLNNRLWITRMKRGLSRKRLAAWLGHRTTSQLARWEAGTALPSLENALLLSHFLQMPVEFLYQRLREDRLKARAAANAEAEVPTADSQASVPTLSTPPDAPPSNRRSTTRSKTNIQV